MRRVLGLVVLLLSLTAVSTTAHAGGFEYTGAGTRSMGRGGASAAAPDDPMALQFNPAMLAELPGGQLLLNFNNAMYDACISRPGSYASPSPTGATGTTGLVSSYGDSNDPGGFATQQFPRVCNQNNVFAPGVSIVYTHQIADGLGLGFGILTPMAAGHTRYSNVDGSVQANGFNLPSPVRYNLIEQNHIQIFPTVGIGWRAASWLHVGLAFQWGIVTISNKNIAVAQMNEEPATDLYADINVHDYFVPAIIGSIHIEPMRGLDLMIGGRWLDTIRASGTANITANMFADPNDTSPMAQQVTTAMNNVRLRVPEGSSVTIGARYGWQRGGAVEQATRTHRDRMRDEIFDLEVNATYELNNVVNQFELNIPPNMPGVNAQNPVVDVGGGANAPLPSTVILPHQWKNQLVLRLGGDWNVLPGVLAVRAGMHYESSGITPAYTQLDFLPGQRIGVHLGGTYRMGNLDLSLAYSHIFQETITVDPSVAAYHQISGLDAGNIINAGTYTAHYNVLSVGANYHF